MLIKQADDHDKRLALLESLEDVPTLDRVQREWLSNQIWALRVGRSGERNAAHYIDSSYKDNPNLAVIHDLRLEMEDEVAQIDHLIISRGFIFYLLETKSFNGNLSINEHGEFTVHYGSGSRGIPSPLEQSKRHEKVLAKWLERLEMTGRMGGKPQFFHAVLIDPKGTIHRPAPDKFDTSNVIKADQFHAWRTRHVEQGISVAQTLTAMVNLRGGDTVREWAQKLARQHRPLPPQQWLPGFMLPRGKTGTVAPSPSPGMPEPSKGVESASAHTAQRVACASCAKPLTFAEQAFCSNNSTVFHGRMLCMVHQKEYRRAKRLGEHKPVSEDQAVEAKVTEQSDPRKRKLICCACDAKITYEEGKFCWNNERRFGGLQYCRTHQADFR